MTIEYRELLPAADLAPFVRHYWLLKGENTALQPHAIFPDGSPEIIFNLADPVVEYENGGAGHTRQPAAMLVGQMTRALWIAPMGRMHMVGVKLAPWGASAFCDADAIETRGHTLRLSDAFTRGHAVANELDAVGCVPDAALASHLDRFFRRLLGRRDQRRIRRMASVAAGLRNAPAQSVDAWSRTIGCSARTLERTFDAHVGVPPKVLMRLRRFQRALQLGTDVPALTLSAVAARTGYTDQSHLVREFREFAGAPPSTAIAGLTEFSSRFLSGDEPD